MTEQPTLSQQLRDAVPVTQDFNHSSQAELMLAAADEIERLREAVEAFQSYGCPVCNGDCASANPPVSCCPMRIAMEALRK